MKVDYHKVHIDTFRKIPNLVSIGGYSKYFIIWRMNDSIIWKNFNNKIYFRLRGNSKYREYTGSMNDYQAIPTENWLQVYYLLFKLI